MSSPDLPRSGVIGIDGSRLTGRFRTGTETYSIELLRRMAAIADDGELRVYLNASEVPEDLPSGPDYRLIPFRRLWTHVRLAREVTRHPPGVLFVPAHVIPLRHPRSVVTIHDAGFRRVPGKFATRERTELDAATRWNLREATKVIAVSRQTRSDLVDQYSIDARNASVIHHGVDDRFQPVSAEKSAEVCGRHGLERPFILSVGTRHHRKNFDTVIRSFELIRAAGIDVDMVIAGAHGPASESLAAQKEASPFAAEIHLLDYVPSDDLPAIYGGAELFILLSWHEGFGLPALEAMACGTPVVASSTGALSEVCGSAARQVDPRDVRAVANAIEAILGSETVRSRMTDVGLAWSRRFTWERSARMTLNLLRAVRDGKQISEERLAWSDAADTWRNPEERQ